MRISVIQMSPGSVKSDNIAQARQLIDACVASDRPDLVVLPEIWTCLGGDRATKFAAAEEIPSTADGMAGGEAFAFLQGMARAHRLIVHGGSIGELRGDRLLNTSLMFGQHGDLIGRYSKIHLFDIVTPSGAGYRESDTYSAGDDVATVGLEHGGVAMRAGLAICYDLRFGELFHRLRKLGSDVVLLPAAFTAETGEAHWETLIRARAIETQCWFAAAGTVGTHLDADGHRRSTWGHSMIVDPWGTVVAQASTGPGWATARIDPDRTARVRAGIPVMDHRRLL